MPDFSDPLIRFDSFTLDPQHRLLLRDHEPIPLTPKQFELLLYFVQNPGRVLTKEELLQAIWPGQFVEEGSLSQSVFWVRKALAQGIPASDDARRHIVTLPGKGYQFNFLEAPPVGAEAVPLASEPLPVPARKIPWMTVAGVVVVVGLAGAFVAQRTWHSHGAAPEQGESQPQHEVILAQFVDNTSDPSLKTSLATALRIGLEQSPRLAIAPDSEIEETLKFMQVPPNTALTPTLASEICERRGAETLVMGSVASVGDEYVVGVEATNCATKKIVSADKVTVRDKERVLTALDGLLPNLRARLGESSTSVRQFNTTIEQATTPSLEAFKAYVAGNELRLHGDNINAIPLYQQAISLDPNFAMAYARLGASYATLSERARSVAAYTKAYALSTNVSQPEKFYIKSLYVHRVERNMFDVIRIHDEWRTLYPQDSHSWISEADALTQMGRFEDAIRIAEVGYRQNPNDGIMAMAMARAYQRSGRFDDLHRVATEAGSKGIESWDIHEMLWYSAVALGDSKTAEAERNWVKGKPEEYQALDDEAGLQLQLGKLRESEATWDNFETVAKQESMTGYADIDIGAYVVSMVELGSHDRALAVLKRWPAVTPTPEYARALAAVGREAEAETVMGKLIKEYPNDTLLNLWHKPILEAQLALNRDGEAAAKKALVALEPANAIGMRDYNVAYFRGKAYLRLHQYSEAASQFKSIVDAPGVDPLSALRPLALLGLARSTSPNREDQTSELTYGRVLAQWKDADANLPILAEVKAELRQVQAR